VKFKENSVITWEPKSITSGGDVTTRMDFSLVAAENIGLKVVPCSSQHRSKQQPIRLPLKDIAEIILCPCKRHATIGLKSIIKLIWQKDGKWLSSGFALSDSVEEVGGFLSSLRTSA
jgi:hypothetical protein